MTDNQADAAAKQRDEATKKHAEETKKKLAEDREARGKAAKDAGVGDGSVKPTPTQEENDLAASGVPVLEHEADGSPEQNPGVDPQHKQSEAKPTQRGGYATRAATPAPARHE
jgi:hypothetical protein